jgi:3-hydroxyisobutyrate dehydrogenase-like beta-hydroxyacid dehydrogenase
MNAAISRVGLIGLGKMGRPITGHLLKGGFAVAGHDVSADALDAAAVLGVRPAGSPRDVAARSDLVIVLVGFDAEVEEVVFGDDGLLAGLAPGGIVAVASTVAPHYMRDLAERAAARGAAALDVPLCRGERAAADGKLLVMGGGDKEPFDRCRPVLGTFADAVFHLGPVGAGQVGKMANNLILWTCISGNSEALRLAQSLGVEPEALRQALLESSAGNWALATRAETNPMPWAEKDMTIVLKEADAQGLSLPLCGVVKEVIKDVKARAGAPTPKPRTSA